MKCKDNICYDISGFHSTWFLMQIKKTNILLGEWIEGKFILKTQKH